MSLDAIRRNKSDTYEVVISVEPGHCIRTFEFTVEHCEVELVTWTDEFAAWLQQDVGVARPILSAILAFHMAQKVERP